MADIFISYSKSDPEPTRQIASYLEVKGYTVWWDTSLTAGEDFREKITQELQSSKAVIVIWTPNSVQSAWVISEADFARKNNKLIPVRTKDVEDLHIPMPFNVLHAGFSDNHAAIEAALSNLRIEPTRPQIDPTIDLWQHAFEYAVKTGDLSDLEDIEVQAHGTPWALRAKQERRRLQEEAAVEKQQRAAERLKRFKEEGRFRINAGCLHNDCGEWFMPGSGKKEWFQDFAWSPEMIVIPTGNCMMGSPADEEGHDDSEMPVHQIAIDQAFAIGRFAVTVDEWNTYVAETGYQDIDRKEMQGDHPAAYVSWIEAKAYTTWLSQKTGELYDLPSEAQWEYCARGYNQSPFWWGANISPDQANYNASHPYGTGISGLYRGETVPVHTFRSNEFGLYNMLGNVWEWTNDCWHDNFKNAPLDGTSWQETDGGDCSQRVLKGGSWFSDAKSLRCARRVRFDITGWENDFGFRVVRKLV